MKTEFRQFTASDFDAIASMMINLYDEDPGSQLMNYQKAYKTLTTLLNHPAKGTVLVLQQQDIPVGYAILIYFWSNEYGGTILNIDELYIQKNYRSRGFGTALIKFLAGSRFADAVLLQLEVTPANTRAKEFYERLGFKQHPNATFDLELNL